jgi:hypothetical protein
MTQLFTRNGKLKKASAYTVNFGIPALKTCPMKDVCGKYCYANKGAYSWPVVKKAYEHRFQQTRRADFPQIAVKALSKKRKLEKVRIHDSGDFYNKEYLYKWFKIAESMPDKEFYAYTKQVKLLKDNWTNKPSNLTIIFSIGGKQDSLIDQNIDRHSKIFKTLEELNASGYNDTSDDDTQAVNPENHKVGLVIH